MSQALVIATGALLWMTQGLLWGAEPRQIQLQWSELGPRVADRKVALVLPDGTHVEGKVRAVEGDGLRLKVTKTSDRRALPKGEQVIARQSISLVRVTEYRKLGRLLGTLGALAIAGGIVAANYPDLYEGAVVVAVPAATAAGMVGVGIGGYYAGKALDKRVTEIRIVREQSGHPEP